MKVHMHATAVLALKQKTYVTGKWRKSHSTVQNISVQCKQNETNMYKTVKHVCMNYVPNKANFASEMAISLSAKSSAGPTLEDFAWHPFLNSNQIKMKQS